MLVAYIKADREALFSFFSDPGKFYAADPYTFLFAALLILIFGPGKISLDFCNRVSAYEESCGAARLHSTLCCSSKLTRIVDCELRFFCAGTWVQRTSSSET